MAAHGAPGPCSLSCPSVRILYPNILDTIRVARGCQALISLHASNSPKSVSAETRIREAPAVAAITELGSGAEMPPALAAGRDKPRRLVLPAMSGTHANLCSVKVRYTYRARVGARNAWLLEAEWDRCRWVWNQCVELDHEARRLARGTGGKPRYVTPGGLDRDARWRQAIGGLASRPRAPVLLGCALVCGRARAAARVPDRGPLHAARRGGADRGGRHPPQSAGTPGSRHVLASRHRPPTTTQARSREATTSSSQVSA